MNLNKKNFTIDEFWFAYSSLVNVFTLQMKSTTVRSILDELPPDVRDIITHHAVQQEQDINRLIKQWIISAAEQLVHHQTPEASSPPDQPETAA